MKRYSISLRIRSKWGEIRTRITPNADTFYAVYWILPMLSGEISYSINWTKHLTPTKTEPYLGKHRSLLCPLDIKTWKNKTMKIFLYGCLMFGYISLTTNFLHPLTKLDFNSNNLYFYCTPPKNIRDNLP